MRFMGDSYIKSEFRLTRSTDNPLHIVAFLGQWKLYLDDLESSISSRGDAADIGTKQWRGRKLDSEAFEKMSKEQVGQLYELMHATRDVWKSPEQLEREAQAAAAGNESSS
ncbi:acetate non-utilizing protein 9, mitochondrial [Kwoniella heveanensis CBS 569]|uniref:Succinate dehydrogenase assembly factor 3 n=1 Tax=Kwoniella heveanensis BCC8398 TaxID=1296120 RepID=A0A1B9GZJ4_9TREE|nr:acetate non-utilizing protein 9, mitochondrial [Kwoniella heveanensis BCC8398]OCF44156.1 acetate non-utilizing protein 9, mitochondrial [Kwoniella heveanensis CBS 569]